jgi:hypothetical protein
MKDWSFEKGAYLFIKPGEKKKLGIDFYKMSSRPLEYPVQVVVLSCHRSLVPSGSYNWYEVMPLDRTLLASVVTHWNFCEDELSVYSGEEEKLGEELFEI